MTSEVEEEASVLAGFSATPEIKNKSNEKLLTQFHRLVASRRPNEDGRSVDIQSQDGAR